MRKRIVQWDREVLQSFHEAIRYIRKDSPQNAEMVKSSILAKVSDLAASPELHPPDKFKKDNDGNNYRAFELHRYRISYLVKEEKIIIARFRHTSQKPHTY